MLTCILCIVCIGNMCKATLRQSYGHGWYDNSPAPANTRGATIGWSSWKAAFTQPRHYHFLAPGQQLINQFPSQQSSAASDKETWAGHAISPNRTHPFIPFKLHHIPKVHSTMHCVSLCLCFCWPWFFLSIYIFCSLSLTLDDACAILCVLSQRTIRILNAMDLDERWWTWTEAAFGTQRFPEQGLWIEVPLPDRLRWSFAFCAPFGWVPLPSMFTGMAAKSALASLIT